MNIFFILVDVRLGNGTEKVKLRTGCATGKG